MKKAINRIWSNDSKTPPLGVFLICIGLFGQGFQLNADSPTEEQSVIRYLGIGNSFTWDSTEYLGQIAESQGENMEFFVAGIGGASIEEHLKRIEHFEKDPSSLAGRPYRRSIHAAEIENYSLKAILQQEAWDYISIQQLSRLSFSPHSYEPHAEHLISYIRKYAPGAEIVIHMTWAYRKDHEWFNTGMWSQQEMFDGLTESYTKLSQKYDLRIVPIGAAIQEAREMKDWSFSFPDPNFNYENPIHPNLPKQNGSLNVGWTWSTNEKTGDVDFRRDSNHANTTGRYLGGLVHFEFLFGKPVNLQSVFTLDELEDNQVKSLIKAAYRSVRAYQRVAQ